MIAEEVFKLVLAALVGALVGWEREMRGSPAGVRTHVLIGMASALFAILSMSMDPSSPSRVASNIVVGIGFLGAGMILRDHGQVHGLTSAASVWGVAAAGMAIGVGEVFLALVATAIMILVSAIPHFRQVVPLAAPSQGPGGKGGKPAGRKNA